MRNHSMHGLVLALLAIALVVAGCGGKKSAVTTTAAAAETTTAAATTTATAAATTTTALAGVASAADCKQLGDLGTKFSAAMSGASHNTDLKKVAQLLREFAAKTPKDIRPDFQLVADDYGKIADAVGSIKAGTAPDPKALAKLQSISKEIDTTKLSQASLRISGWLQKNCRT